MKMILNRPSHSARAGFTLVELLVVIGIIAILAGVLLSGGTAALKAAQRTKAANLGAQIQTGAMAYYTEYSLYPVPIATTTDYKIGDSSSADGTSWGILLSVLSGNVCPSDGTAFTVPAAGPLNKRAIGFLSLKSSEVITTAGATKDAPKNPLPISPTSAAFFNLAVDSDYSGVIGDTSSAVTGFLPNFQTSTTSNMYFTGTSTAGIVVFANCNGASTTNPGFWVRTY